jgi:hypothetical protein
MSSAVFDQAEPVGAAEARRMETITWRTRLPNVAVLTRESPSEARVSSAFNTQLGGVLPVTPQLGAAGSLPRSRDCEELSELLLSL